MYLILDSNGIPWVFEVYLQSKNMNFRVGFPSLNTRKHALCFIKIIVSVLAFVLNVIV